MFYHLYYVGQIKNLEIHVALTHRNEGSISTWISY
jgi:hypothetical protein